MMLTAIYCALSLLLMIPSDRAHRQALGAVIVGLVALYVIAALVPNQMFYLIQASFWVGLAAALLHFNRGWQSINLGAISLVIAGVSVFPAWLGSAELVAFQDLSLVVSGCFGAAAILCFGSPGIRRAGAWIWDLGRDLGIRRAGHSLRGSGEEAR